MKALVSSGIVEGNAVAIARFLRENPTVLDKTMVGEYLGHHDETEVCPGRMYFS